MTAAVFSPRGDVIHGVIAAEMLQPLHHGLLDLIL